MNSKLRKYKEAIAKLKAERKRCTWSPRLKTIDRAIIRHEKLIEKETKKQYFEKKVIKSYTVRKLNHDEAVLLVGNSNYDSVSDIVDKALEKFVKSEKKKDQK